MAFKRCTHIVYNTLAEDFDDLDEFFDSVSVDFLLSGIVSQKLHDFSIALLVIIPVQGCFPVYRLTVSQARKANLKH